MRHLQKPEGTLVSFVVLVVGKLGQWTSIICGFYFPHDYSPEETSKGYQRRLVVRVDCVLLAWWLVTITCYFLAFLHPFVLSAGIAMVIVMVRILNLTTYNLRNLLVDTNPKRSGNNVGIVSARRSTVLGIASFVELAVCFASIYAANRSALSFPTSDADDWFTYLYFSFITQLTIGYGDVRPLHSLRIATCVQGVSGLLIISVVIGKFVGLLRVGELSLPGAPRQPTIARRRTPATSPRSRRAPSSSFRAKYNRIHSVRIRGTRARP